MANPNLKNLTSVFGENASLTYASSTPTAIVTCDANQLLKVNSLYATNTSSAGTINVTVDIHNGSSILSYLIAGLAVGPGGTINIITFDSPLYLTENQSIRVTASANSAISAVTSFERIS
jgi:opacity protein-like surface antigen